MDAVQRIVSIVAETAQLDARALAAAEARIREEMGGQRVNIIRRAPITTEEIQARLSRRESVTQMAEDLGVSRGAIYRLLRARRPSKVFPRAPT